MPLSQQRLGGLALESGRRIGNALQGRLLLRLLLLEAPSRLLRDNKHWHFQIAAETAQLTGAGRLLTLPSQLHSHLLFLSSSLHHSLCEGMCHCWAQPTSPPFSCAVLAASSTCSLSFSSSSSRAAGLAYLMSRVLLLWLTCRLSELKGMAAL